MSSRPGGPGTKVVNDLSPEAVIKSIHIAQGLGATSAYTWLKLPAVDDMERVMDATTMPTLILGGDPVDDDPVALRDRKSTRLNSSHVAISYAVFCLKKKKIKVGYRHSGCFLLVLRPYSRR